MLLSFRSQESFGFLIPNNPFNQHVTLPNVLSEFENIQEIEINKKYGDPVGICKKEGQTRKGSQG